MLLLVMSSCATMFGGSKYVAQIQPSSPDSEVFINDESYGTGDIEVKRKRNKELEVKLVSPQGESVTKTYEKEVRVGTGILSFLSWGFAGPLLDLGTGAIFRPDTDSRDVTRVSTKKYRFNVTSPPPPVAAPVKNNN